MRDFDKHFDLEIDRDELNLIAPALLETVKEFVALGLCRQANTFDRKCLAEGAHELAAKALKQYPTLKLNHMGAKTIVIPA